jgi:hypothetical protein
MTPKIATHMDQSGTADTDFAALADQFLQSSRHLPPEGDQSWREQDAQRIFSGHGKDETNQEPPAAEDADPADGESDAHYEPGFPPLRPGVVLLSLVLATGLMFAVVVVSAPGILTAGFWNAPGSRSAPAPVDVAGAAPVVQAAIPHAAETLRPSLADSGKAASPPLRAAAVQAATSHRKIRIAQAPAKAPVAKTLVAKVAGAKVPAHTKRHRLPPIGEAYFASHAPAVAARKTASAEWKAEVARWDELANQIRARRQNIKGD